MFRGVQAETVNVFPLEAKIGLRAAKCFVYSLKASLEMNDPSHLTDLHKSIIRT